MISKILWTATTLAFVFGLAADANQDLSKLSKCSGIKVQSSVAPEEKQDQYVIFSKEAFSNLSFQKVEPNVVSSFFWL